MIGSRARPSAYQIRKILFAPGARGVCHDPEKPFFGNLPRVSFRSPSPRFLQTPRNRPRHNTPPPLSVKGSQSRSGKRPHHPHVRPGYCLLAFQCRSTAFRQARQLQDPLNSASLTFCRLPLSGNALQRWNESILLSSPSLAFIQEASLRSFVDTLVLGFELCGTYQQKTLATSTVYGTQPLTSVRKIRGFLERNSRLFGAQRTRAAASYLVDGSASPRETQAALLLGLPAFYGGYGLGMPSMNYEISCTPQATAISGRRTLRCDLFWPEASIAVEYQSREFHSGDLCRIRDSRRTNALQAMGIAVVGLTNNELESVEATDVIVETVRKAQGVRFRTAVGNYHARKLRLRRQLGLPLYPYETFAPRPYEE